MLVYFHTTVKIWNILKDFQKYFYLQLFLIILVQLCDIGNIYLFSKVIDAVATTDFSLAYWLVASAATLYGFRIIVNYFQNKNELQKLDITLFQFLEKYSADRILKLNPFQYIEDHSIVKFQVIQNGERAIRNIVSTFLLSILPVLTMITFSVVAILIFSPVSALVVLVSSLIVLVWSSYFTKYLNPFLQTNNENWTENGRQRGEMFTHLELIKNSGVEESFVNGRMQERKHFGDFGIATFLKRLNHGQKRYAFLVATRYSVLLYLVYLLSVGKITLGSLYSIHTWLTRSYDNIFNLVQLLRQIPTNFIEAEKYFKIIDKEPEFNEDGKCDFANGNIEFKNIYFRYPKGDKDVLSNLSFTIPIGKKVAFVGVSGSGKTSIIKLLLRVYDYRSGQILINTVDTRDINARSLRKNIGYVEQHVDLFDSSIRDNILIGIDHKKRKAIDLTDIVNKSRISEFYHRLGETGLDTLIGERGVKLSGGERQRVGIARALIKNPSILVFDEATASLDTVNEKYIQEAVDESSVGRTTIIIAHRLSTVQNADIIFVINNGSLEASGTHNELLQTSKTYKNLVEHQFAS